MTPLPQFDFGSLFLSIKNGLNVTQDKSGRGLPITRIETISSGDVDSRRVGFANLNAADAAQWLLQHGDILFSHINSPDRVGHCARYTGTPEMLVHGMNLLCLRPDPAAIDSSYLLHLLRSDSFRVKLEPFINRAVNQASVSIANLRNIKVYIPPPDEQRRIAAILDQADDLRRKRQAANQLVTTLQSSYFIKHFGDPLKTSNDDKLGRLGDFCTIKTGKLDANKADEEGRFPFFTCAVEPLRIDIPAFKGKAALVAGNGDLNVKYYEGEFNAYQRTYVIQSKDEDRLATRLIAAFLSIYVDRLRSQSIGGVIKYIKLGNLTEARIKLPTSAEQADFMDFVDTYEELCASLKEASTRSDDLLRCLQHHAFEGKLRSVPLGPAFAFD